MTKQEKILNERLFEINKRLGVVISLLLRMLQKEKPAISIREQVRVLDDLEIRPRDIADILGRTPTHITKELAGIHKDAKRKNEK